MTTTTIETTKLERPERLINVKGHFQNFSNCTQQQTPVTSILLYNAKCLLTETAVKPEPVQLERPAITAIRGLWYLATNYAINIDGTLVDDRFRTRLMDAEKIQEYGKFYAMFQNDPDCLRFEHIDPKYW